MKSAPVISSALGTAIITAAVFLGWSDTAKALEAFANADSTRSGIASTAGAYKVLNCTTSSSTGERGACRDLSHGKRLNIFRAGFRDEPESFNAHGYELETVGSITYPARNEENTFSSALRKQIRRSVSSVLTLRIVLPQMASARERK